jgi:hypothetical protein
MVSCASSPPADTPKENICLNIYDIKLKGKKGLEYETSNYKVNFQLQNPYTGIGISIQNKTNSEISINWDKASFVDVNKKAHGVTHEGVKYKDATASKPPSTIPPGAELKDFVIMSDSVSFERSNWQIKPFLFIRSSGEKDKAPEIEGLSTAATQKMLDEKSGLGQGQSLKGKTFSLYLPLIIKNKSSNENYVFEIKSVSCSPN